MRKKKGTQSAIHRDLVTPKYRPRVVKDKRKLTRQKWKRETDTV